MNTFWILSFSHKQKLAVPPGVDGLCRGQLNELLANMPYHQRNPESCQSDYIGACLGRFLLKLQHQGVDAALTRVQQDFLRHQIVTGPYLQSHVSGRPKHISGRRASMDRLPTG